MFDRKLRLITLEAIERLEVSVRARWTNRMSLKSGSHAHLHPANFIDGTDHVRSLARVAEKSARTSEIFVEHYRRKYSDPFMAPLWAVTELMSFGELSKWVAATKNPDIKSALAKDLGLPNKEVLEGVLAHLSYVRNLCAHHCRLWNRRNVKRIPKIKRMLDCFVLEPAVSKEQRQLSNRIFNTLVLLVVLIRHQSVEATLPTRLKELLLHREPWHRKAMGFHVDWASMEPWAAF